MTSTPPPEYDPNDLCEDEEVFACGDGGSSDDQKFDTIIGVIEDFMCSFNVMELFPSLPPLSEVDSDHDRHVHHKSFVALIEKRLDDHLAERLPGLHVTEVAKMIESRMSEVGEEIWDFVQHGCMDYISFMALWKDRRP